MEAGEGALGVVEKRVGGVRKTRGWER